MELDQSEGNKMDLYLDTETTGLDETAEIIQIGIIDGTGKVMMNQYLKPAFPIPEEVTEIHGITNEDVMNAPCWQEIHDEVTKILSQPDVVLKIYNAPFDLRMIKQTVKLWGGRTELTELRAHCLMRSFADRYNDGRWSKLLNACIRMNIDVSDLKAHDAVSDCEMTRRLDLAMQKARVKERKAETYREAVRLRKMELVPDNWREYPDFGQGHRPEGCKTLSQLRISDLEHYEFLGQCCSTYGDKGFLFAPKAKYQK